MVNGNEIAKQVQMYGKGAKQSRSRTGCLTCRKRRIKCDEGKPRCQNCIPRDRTCIYKIAEEKPRKKNSPKKTTSLSSWHLTTEQEPESSSSHTSSVIAPRDPLVNSAFREIKPTDPDTFVEENMTPKTMQWNNGYRYAESPLLDPENYLAFTHYVQHVAPMMSLIDPSPTQPNIFTIKPGYQGHLNLWSYKLPVMALQYPPLLLAILAIAQLHRANLGNTSPHEPLVHYHRALRRISHDLVNDRRDGVSKDGTALLTATLTLAFYETWTGDHGAWRRHMIGAAEMLRKYVMNWAISSASSEGFHVDLFFWYAKMDVIQSFLSGDPLLLPLEFWKVPIRASNDTLLGLSDSLIYLMASAAEFLGRDRMRKEQEPNVVELHSSALHTWSAICADLRIWEDQLHALHNVREDPSILTPYGAAALYYDDVRISALRHLSFCLCIHLSRGHPDRPVHPRQSIAAAAHDTAPIVSELLAHVAGCFRPQNFQQDLMDDSHIIATLYNAAWPLFVAGLQVREPETREWILSTLSTIYQLSGWATAVSLPLYLHLLMSRNDANTD